MTSKNVQNFPETIIKLLAGAVIGVCGSDTDKQKILVDKIGGEIMRKVAELSDHREK